MNSNTKRGVKIKATIQGNNGKLCVVGPWNVSVNLNYNLTYSSDSGPYITDLFGRSYYIYFEM